MAHVLVLDSNEDVFVCGTCKTVFNSLEIFLNHKNNVYCGKEAMKNISQSKSVITDNHKTIVKIPDSQQTIEEISLEDSIIPSKTDENMLMVPFSCQICGKTMKSRKSLSAHHKAHSLKSYQCLVCGRCFIQKSHLQRHIQSHRVWPESLSSTTAKSADSELLGYSCPYCKDTFPNYSPFRAHLKCHENLKAFKCIQGDCLCLFENLENLLNHVSSDHTDTVYRCYMCNERFKSLNNIYSHQQSHNDLVKDSNQSKRYKCLQCDAVYNTPEKLSLHVQTENHKKKCIHCNKIFSSNKRLRLHLQIHRHEKPFKCHICCVGFNMKKYLDVHMLRHSKRNFVCFICKSMFKRQDLLQRHIRLHQVNKVFKCPYKETLNCNKEFSRSDKFKLHMKSHQNHVLCPALKEKHELNKGTIDIIENG